MHAALGPRLTRKQIAVIFVSSTIMVVLAGLFRSAIPLSAVKYAAIVIVAPVIGLLIFSYPKYGFYFTVFYIYAGLNYYSPLPLAAPLVMLVTLAVLFRVLRGEDTPLENRFFAGSLCLFIAFSIQSMVYAWYPEPALVALTKILKLLVVLFACLQLIRTPRDYEQLAMTILAGIVATVLLGVVNMKMGWERDATVLIGVLDFKRFAGTHLNPNTGALYMVSGIPLAVYTIKRAGTPIRRIACVVVAIGLAVATIMTFSRQAFFPLMFVIVAVFLREGRNRWGYISATFVIFAIAFLVPPYYWYRLSSLSKMIQGMSEDWSFMLRIQAHKTAWHLFTDAPFTGIGLNNFPLRSATELIRRIPVHNAYLDVLSWVGIFGFLAYMAFILSGIRGFTIAARAPWDDTLKWMSDLSYYFLISLFAVMVGAIFQSVALYYLLWLPVAGGVIAQRLAKHHA